MKNSTTKTTVLLIIHILILSQIAFAETFDDNNLNKFDSEPNDEFDSDQDAYSKGKYADSSQYQNTGMPAPSINRQGYPGKPIGQSQGEFKNDQLREGINSEYEFEKRESTFNPQSGPSYEGFNKEQMLFGRLFPYIEDGINSEEIKQYCDNPRKMADSAIEKIKAKIGSISNVCNGLGKEEIECKETAMQKCSMMRQPDTSYAIDELHRLEILSQSCPINTDAIKQACILRMKENFEDRSEFIQQNCEMQWENYGKQNQQNCEKKQSTMICDESKYLENCLSRYGSNEEQNKCPGTATIQKPSCENGYLKEKTNNDGCLTGYECIYNQPQQTQCLMTNDEADRLANECSGRKGTPERMYNNGCATEVKCKEFQCPYTNEQVSEKESACSASNGRFEKKMENNCVMQMECFPQDAAGTGITGNVAGYDPKQQCHNEWQQQKQNCENVNKQCRGKDDFVSECASRESGAMQNNIANIGKQCEMESKIQIKHMERQCAMMDSEKQRCLDDSSKRCGMMEGVASECREKVTEENFRKFIISEF